MTFFLDSNVIIDLIAGNSTILEKLKEVYQDDSNSIKIPDIVFYEVLRGFRYKEAKKKEDIFIQFCQKFGIVRMSLQTLEIAADIYGKLYRNGTPLTDGDILIGSLAVEHDAVLVTNNTKHFNLIDGIRLEDWKSA